MKIEGSGSIVRGIDPQQCLARKEETPSRVVGLHLTFQICGIGNPQEIYGASSANMLTPSLEEKRCVRCKNYF
jgi:hypothetical protein